MSLDEYKMPSLKDKIREQAKADEVSKEKVPEEKKEVEEVKVTKGRRLNK